jgi:cytochrome c nitrite reductase small subunit
MRKFLNLILPPEKWNTAVIIVLGMFSGLIVFAIYISNAGSYLSDNPKVCVNCHIMSPQYTTWSHSSHKSITNCNDCHVPHNNILNKYYFKAKDGLRHATIFTLRKEPQVIFIREAGIRVVQQNCLRCHEHAMDLIITKNHGTTINKLYTQERLCWDCHRDVPHGTVNSLSSVTHSMAPLPKSPVPQWIRNIFNK